jgi:putative ABC transport system permease protein
MSVVRPPQGGRVRLSAAVGFYLVRLRRRWPQELLAVLGIAAGVALLYSTEVASTSMSGPVRHLNQGLVGSSQLQVLVRGGATYSEQVYDAVMAVPGVVRAAPILQVPGTVDGPRGERDLMFFGADPRIVQLRGNLLQGFRTSEAAKQESIVIPAPVAHALGVQTGDDVRLRLAGRSVVIPVLVGAREQIGSLVTTSMALAPLAYLQRLSGHPGRVSRLLVEARPGQVGRVRDALRPIASAHAADVRPAQFETSLFNKATVSWRQSSAIFGLISALVGWLFAVCALLVTAADRRNLAEQQREQGLPSSATIQTLLVDAGAIGVAGVALGLGVGELISRSGFSTDLSFLSGAFPVGDERVVTWQSVVLAGVAGLIAAAVGVLLPVSAVLRDALPIRRSGGGRPEGGPAAAVRRPAWRGPLPLVVLGATTVAVVVSQALPAAVVIALVLLLVALIAALPLVLGAAIAGVARAVERVPLGSAAVVAALQLRYHPWRARALAIAATGAIAVFGASALQGARAKIQSGLDGVARSLDDTAEIWVTPTGRGNLYGTAAFSPGEVDRLQRVPGVARVDLYRAGLLDTAGSRVLVLGQPRSVAEPVPRTDVRQGAVDTASARVRAGGWATLSRRVAHDLGVGIGDRFVLPAPKPASFRVAAITTNFGWPGGSIVINADDFARAWQNPAIGAYLVQTKVGAPIADVALRLRDALGHRSGLSVQTATERARQQSAGTRDGLVRLRQIVQLTILAAILAMGAAMAGLLWQHRAMIAEHKMNGMSTATMWRSLILEAAVLMGCGAVTGLLFGLLGQEVSTEGIEVLTGFPVADGLRIGLALQAFALVLAASVLAVLVPGYLVARTSPLWDD